MFDTIIAITPSDTLATFLAQLAGTEIQQQGGLICEASGHVAAVLADGKTVTFPLTVGNLPLRIRVKQILSTGTSATGIAMVFGGTFR